MKELEKFPKAWSGFKETIAAGLADRRKPALRYGIEFLDLATGGIADTDMIVLGAKTGAGKTHAATIIAMNSAMEGKRVHFVALEAYQFEIERRIAFMKLVHQMKISGLYNTYENFDYLDWQHGKYSDDNIIKVLEQKVVDECGEDLKTLTVHYPGQSFTGEGLEKLMATLHGDCDLLIIDHLHYFDLEGKNENQEMKKLVKGIAAMSQDYKIPTVLIAHLRKSSRLSDAIVPDIEEFHGSSDITKIASHVILLSPASEQDVKRDEAMIAENAWPTFFQIAKFRPDSDRTKYAGVMCYSYKTQNYLKEFSLVKFNYRGDSFEQILRTDKRFPKWLKK